MQQLAACGKSSGSTREIEERETCRRKTDFSSSRGRQGLSSTSEARDGHLPGSSLISSTDYNAACSPQSFAHNLCQEKIITLSFGGEEEKQESLRTYVDDGEYDRRNVQYFGKITCAANLKGHHGLLSCSSGETENGYKHDEVFTAHHFSQDAFKAGADQGRSQHVGMKEQHGLEVQKVQETQSTGVVRSREPFLSCTRGTESVPCVVLLLRMPARALST